MIGLIANLVIILCATCVFSVVTPNLPKYVLVIGVTTGLLLALLGRHYARKEQPK